MRTLKAIDPNRITTFELGSADSEDLLALIIPFENLKNFHYCVRALLEKDKEPQPPGNTGYYLTYRGTLKSQP